MADEGVSAILRDVVSEAAIKALSQTDRTALVEKIFEHIRRGSYHQLSPLDRATNSAAEEIMKEVAKQTLLEDPHFMSELRKLVAKAALHVVAKDAKLKSSIMYAVGCAFEQRMANEDDW